jgi:hypothetical protein
MESVLTRHHRRPRAQGGSNKKYNISLVREKCHRNWHILFDGTLSPEMIALRMNRPERFRPRQAQAWEELFGDKSKRQIARYVTEIFVDPAFTIMYDTKFLAVRHHN